MLYHTLIVKVLQRLKFHPEYTMTLVLVLIIVADAAVTAETHFAFDG